MKFEKKYIKLSVAALAVVALVIGLSVGLTEKNKSNKTLSSSNASGSDNVAAIDNAENCDGQSGKSGKSGGSSRRLLVVPGTEEYVNQAGIEKGRTMRNEFRELQTVKSDGGKAGKADGSGKAGKAGGEEAVIVSCPTQVQEICVGKSGKSAGGSGKSGKSSGGSGSGKSGKSAGGDSTMAMDCSCSSGKSGKSGGGSGKSGKSDGGEGDVSPDGAGKSAKSSGGGSKGSKCSCPPTVCKTPIPTPPDECVCEDLPWALVEVNGEDTCVRRGCGVSEGGEYNTEKECCDENFIGFCLPVDECNPIIITPSPITSIITPNPTPPPFTNILPEPTPSPTTGSTPTVSTDVTGPPTKADRSEDENNEDEGDES